MFAILSQLLFFLGLAIIIFLVVRKIPQSVEGLDSTTEQSLEVQIENHIGKSFFKIPWDKLDSAFERLIEKLMRRIHILILKLEALLQKKIESFKNKNKEKNSFIHQVSNDELTKKEPEIIDLSNIDLDNLERINNIEEEKLVDNIDDVPTEENIAEIEKKEIFEEKKEEMLNNKKRSKKAKN